MKEKRLENTDSETKILQRRNEKEKGFKMFCINYSNMDFDALADTLVKGFGQN